MAIIYIDHLSISVYIYRSPVYRSHHPPPPSAPGPGPVCYKKGGPLTVTDANLVLGRLLPDFFPRIFGPREDEPLDAAAAYTRLQNLTNDVSSG